MNDVIKMNDAIKMTNPKEAYARGERDFRDLPLAYADLSGAYLENADFSGADLFCANLLSADLRSVDFRGSNLFGANLSGADLRGANLSGAELRGANLSGADILGVDFSGAFMDGELRERVEGGKKICKMRDLPLEGTRSQRHFALECVKHVAVHSHSHSSKQTLELVSRYMKDPKIPRTEFENLKYSNAFAVVTAVGNEERWYASAVYWLSHRPEDYAGSPDESMMLSIAMQNAVSAAVFSVEDCCAERAWQNSLLRSWMNEGER